MPCDDNNPLGAILKCIKAACGIQPTSNAFVPTETIDRSFVTTAARREQETSNRSGRHDPRASLRLLLGSKVDKREVTMAEFLLYQPAFTASLIDACKTNNLKLVELLLQRGRADANMIGECGETPLVYASMKGNLEAVLLLFLYGATYDLSKTSPRDALRMSKQHNRDLCIFLDSVELRVNEKTPLSFACSRGNLRAVKLLLKHGANVNEGEPRPIFSACKSENIDLVRVLLRHQADLKVENWLGETPLSYACLKGNLDLARLLLDHGANITTGRTVPINAACKSGNLDLVEFLLSRCGNVNSHKNDDRSHVIFSMKDADTFGGLLDQGRANFDITDGCNPLCYASSADAVQLLLDRGIKLESTDRFQRGPLHLVESAEAARAFIKRGANVRARDMLGLTPLHYVIGINCESRYYVLRELLDKGANVNARCLKRTAPLHSACSETYYKFASDTVGLLLRHGAHVDVLDHRGRTPLHLACFHGVGRDVIELLLDGGADIRTKTRSFEGPLHFACKAGAPRKDVIQLLLDRGASDRINEVNECGQTPLHLLIINFICNPKHKSDERCDEFAQMIKLLVDRGANINVKNAFRQTPLSLTYCKFPRTGKWQDLRFFMAPSVQWKVMDLLMRLGADVNVPNDRGLTLLHVICENNSAYCTEMNARLVIERGADLNAQENTEGMTALHLACMDNNKVNFARVLLEQGAAPDVGDMYGNTALHIACFKRCWAAVRLLLKFGANPMAANVYGQCPTHTIFFYNDAPLDLLYLAVRESPEQLAFSRIY